MRDLAASFLLYTIQNLKQSIAEKTVQFVQFQGVAASFEAEARRMDWDTEEVTAKSAEVQQSMDSLSDFIDKTQAELQALAERLKVSMLHMSGCSFAFWYTEEADSVHWMRCFMHTQNITIPVHITDAYQYQGRWCNALITYYSI